MDDEAVATIHKLIPNAKIIVSHLDNVAHGSITREVIYQRLSEKGIVHDRRFLKMEKFILLLSK